MNHKIQMPPKGTIVTFFPNPFFEEILIFLESIPTSQDKYKPLNDGSGHYEFNEKKNVKEFKSRIQKALKDSKKPWWPFKEYLTIVVNLTGRKSEIERKDLDNYLKTIFDTLKGVVFEDDYLIFEVIARKIIQDFQPGIMIGIKTRSIDSDRVSVPLELFSIKEDKWKVERETKLNKGGICNMDFYNFPYSQ